MPELRPLARVRWSALIISIAVVLTLHVPVRAALTLDPSFGNGGKVTMGATPTSEDSASDAAVQADGKIVFVGRTAPPGQGGAFTDFLICRLQPHGVLDTQFGAGGCVLVDFETWPEGASRVVIQPDAKIVVGGNYHSGDNYALIRFNPDGTFDPTFGVNGKVTGTGIPVHKIELLPNGSFIVSGNKFDRIIMARHNSNGSLDTQFGTQGKYQIVYPTGIYGGSFTTDDAGGFIVATNYQTFNPAFQTWEWTSTLYRLHSDLTRDKRFGRFRGAESYNRDSHFGSVLRLRNGNLLLMDVELFGRGSRRTMQFTPGGRPAGQFAIPNYSGVDHTPTNMIELPNGELAGCSDNFVDIFVAKFSPTSGTVLGTHRLEFLPTIQQDDYCSRVVAQPDNKILVIGAVDTDPSLSTSGDLAIARYIDVP